MALLLGQLVALLLEAGQPGEQAALDALPVLTGNRILALQRLDLAQQFGVGIARRA